MKHYGRLAILGTLLLGCTPVSTEMFSAEEGVVPSPVRGQNDKYAYGSPQFSAFVTDSLTQKNGGNADRFYGWMQARYVKASLPYAGVRYASLSALLKGAHDRIISQSGDSGTAAEEMRFALYLHGFIKKAIPNFSLDGGFEFANAISKGERQCFLQSVLVASLLQKTGINAGVAMVWRNIAGETTNNGHAIALARLADGRDIIVNCSDPTPFVKQQGLFAKIDDEGYRFVSPQYQEGNSTIVGYALASGERTVPARRLQTLDIPFLNSQFDFYRGERAPGGFVASQKTSSGLADSEKHLEESVKACPKNPLAVYVLGRVHLRQGKRQAARRELILAKYLYAQDGWVPEGAEQALNEAQ